MKKILERFGKIIPFSKRTMVSLSKHAKVLPLSLKKNTLSFNKNDFYERGGNMGFLPPLNVSAWPSVSRLRLGPRTLRISWSGLALVTFRDKGHKNKKVFFSTLRNS